MSTRSAWSCTSCTRAASRGKQSCRRLACLLLWCRLGSYRGHVLPDHVPQHVGSLMQRCWDSNPAMRPALPDVISALSHFMQHAGNAAAPSATAGLPALAPLSPASSSSSGAAAFAAPAAAAAAFSPLSVADVTLLVPAPACLPPYKNLFFFFCLSLIPPSPPPPSPLADNRGRRFYQVLRCRQAAQVQRGCACRRYR